MKVFGIIALDTGRIEGNTLIVDFPNSAVLFLRCSEKTPDEMNLCLRTPGGELTYGIPIMKQKNYTIEEIFEKDLLFLVLFYIFSYEKQLLEYDSNKAKLEELKQEYVMLAGQEICLSFYKRMCYLW